MNIYLLLLYILLIPLSCTTVSRAEPTSEIIQFNSNGVMLEGVLELPNRTGKFPLVIFVHGSGMRSRSDYGEFVDPLLKNGFAIFRYDKRGVGNSGGNYFDVDVSTNNSLTTIPALAKDVIAAVKNLKHDPRIDSTRCILVGASQAGWIIPVAASLESIYLTAIFAGPSVTVGEEIYYSSLAENEDYSVEEANKMVLSYRGNRGFDPIPYLSKIKRPALWIFGSRDESIPVDRSVHLLKQARDKFSLPIQIQIAPGVNHGMRSKDGTLTDYVGDILNWINKHMGKN